MLARDVLERVVDALNEGSVEDAVGVETASERADPLDSNGTDVSVALLGIASDGCQTLVSVGQLGSVVVPASSQLSVAGGAVGRAVSGPNSLIK